MKKESVKVLFLFVIISLFSMELKAQSCVYLCTKTGKIGYAYGGSDACDMAIAECKQAGGTNPVKLVSTNKKGWGSIAVGINSEGNPGVAASVGQSSRTEADKEAIRQAMKNGCTDIEIKTFWADF